MSRADDLQAAHDDIEGPGALLAEHAAIPDLLAVVRAAQDPFLVLVEALPEYNPVVNAEMRRAADALRAAVAAFEAGGKPDLAFEAGGKP